MIQRHQLVQSVLQELQEAADCIGLEGLTSAALEVERTLSSFSLPDYQERQFQEELEVDQVAKSLYPEDAPKNMLPLVCKGEGNHLFEAASVLLWGNTGLSLELQVRTAVELILQKQYYLHGMIDSKVMLQAARYALCTEESPAMTSLPSAILEAIFDADIKATCFPGTYANMWHLYALASVLQCNIYSIYPMSNLKIRPYFNRLIRPRKCGLQVSTLHIMWSGQQLSSQVFKAQSFVAVIGLEELEPADPPPESDGKTLELSSESAELPVKTLELLSKDPQVTYSNLREKVSITKSTFYRWRRQSQEHRQRAATRFAAKHFMKTCFQKGRIVPLQQFRQLFPEISRSTYYSWKHELQSMNGEVSSPAEVVFSKEEFDAVPNGASKTKESLGCKSPLLISNQNGISLQGAKSYLEKSISRNNLVPYRTFNRTFPGISRSTYYNWRRKAIRGNPHFKPVQTLSTNQKPPEDRKLLMPFKPESLPSSKVPNGHQPESPVLLRIKPTVYNWPKKLRHVAKKRVCQWQMPFCKFRLRYPRLSSTLYWFWRRTGYRQAKKHQPSSKRISQNLQQATSETSEKAELGVHPLQSRETELMTLGNKMPEPFNAVISGYQISKKVDDSMFVMDVIATAQFKAQAKLFLQQRFESNTFPTYKEFRDRFPLTARSTYYMWKRALHDGLTLVDV